MRWQEVTARLALICGLFVMIVYNVNVWATAPVGLLAIAATVELAIRPYATNTVDKVLLGCGAVVAAFILAGLGLNLTPWGLTRTSWVVAWTIASLGVLAWHRGLGTLPMKPAVGIWSFGPWAFAACFLIIVAWLLALAGVRQWSRQPVLAFALVSSSPTKVVVEIDSTSIGDRYRISATSKISGARRYLSAPVTVRSSGAATNVLHSVPVNAPGVWIIQLKSASDGTTMRWLKVDVR